MQQKIIPNIWFDSEAEAAARFYTGIFTNSTIMNIARFGGAGAEVSGQKEGSVMTVQFSLSGYTMIGINGGPLFKCTPAISFFVACESADEVERLYRELSADGSVLMELGTYPFCERYAWVNDRYGVSWQIYMGKSNQRITPTLMFTGEHYCRAQEAITSYTSIFSNAQPGAIQHYPPGQGEKEEAILHADFMIEGEWFKAFDSGFDHAFTFTPAISFMVNCTDQQEIDRLWTRLSSVPAAEQCGWLQDSFGISWQIVPEELGRIFSAAPGASERIMKAMLQMKKLDIAALKAAAR